MSKSSIGILEFYSSLFSFQSGPRKLSFRRVVKMLFLMSIYELLRLFNRLFLTLDLVFFPSFLKTSIDRPVMIVSMPRCGTTYLHHTLANHDEVFTTMKLWELIFAPSIIQKKFWLSISWLDSKILGGLGSRIGWKVVQLFIGDTDKHHVMELSAPEEDELGMIWYRSTSMLLVLLADANPVKKYLDFNNLDESVQDHWMKTYKRLIQRHIYCMDPKGERRFLSKNPFFMPKSKALKKQFPDAQIISNLRNPLDSFKSSVSNTLGLMGVEIKINNADLIEELVGYFTLWQEAGKNEVEVNFESQHLNVLFPELISNKEDKCSYLAEFLGIEKPLRWPKEGGRKHATHAQPLELSEALNNKISSTFPELVKIESNK